MGKPIIKGLKWIPSRVSKGYSAIAKDTTNALGITQTDAVKREQRDIEAKAKASADASVQASKNLSINSLVDLGSADNAPDVVAGGTADALGLGSGMKRKKGGLSSQLGIQV